jgi:hypothetical protein
MQFAHTRWGSGLATLSAAAVLALGLAACGDSGDDEGAGDSAADATKEQAVDTSKNAAQASDSPDEQRVRAAFTSLQKSFASGDGQAACGGMTATAQEDVIGLLVADTCPTTIAKLADQPDSRTLPPKIDELEIDGQTAVVSTSYPGKDFQPQRFRYVKQNGEWKLATLKPLS